MNKKFVYQVGNNKKVMHKMLTYASETWILTERDGKQTFLKIKCIEEF